MWDFACPTILQYNEIISFHRIGFPSQLKSRWCQDALIGKSTSHEKTWDLSLIPGSYSEMREYATKSCSVTHTCHGVDAHAHMCIYTHTNIHTERT